MGRQGRVVVELVVFFSASKKGSSKPRLAQISALSIGQSFGYSATQREIISDYLYCVLLGENYLCVSYLDDQLCVIC